jgi:hypothetical protein
MKVEVKDLKPGMVLSSTIDLDFRVIKKITPELIFYEEYSHIHLIDGNKHTHKLFLCKNAITPEQWNVKRYHKNKLTDWQTLVEYIIPLIFEEKIESFAVTQLYNDLRKNVKLKWRKVK